MTLEVLIFDVDGTLADTEETHRQAFNATFMQYELDWDWSPSRYAELLNISGGQERLAAFIGSLRLDERERVRLLGLVPAIHREKTRLFNELIADGRARFRPGVARLIGEARAAGLRLAIASTTTSANVDALIRTNLGPDARGQFAAIACGDQVPDKKPAPDVYRLVLGELGVPAAACVAFEDSGNGVKAAKAAGLYTVVTPTTWTAGQDFSAADLVLRSLGDRNAPLEPPEAERVGGPWLGVRELRALHGAARAATRAA
jgi:HAD superfamily hydrolase (TIGR01509 family)